jgi:MFS family permease
VTLPFRRTPIYYGWVVVVAGVFGNATSAGFIFWATAVYIPAVSDDLGVGRFPVVTGFVVGQAVSAAVGLFAGAYMDRYGARRAIVIGTLIAPIGLVLTSFSTELWHLYVGWAVVGVARPFLLPTTYNWLATRWFDRRRQSAIGLVAVGLGVGGVLLPGIAALEEAFGWQGTMRMTAAILFAVQGLIALLVVRDGPAELGLEVEGGRRAVGAGAPPSPAPLAGFTLAEAMRGRVFWLIAAGLALFFMGQGAVNVLGVDFFESRGVAGGATILGISAAIRASGRLPVGLMLSRVERVFLLAVLVSATQALALAVVIPSTEAPAVVAFVLLWGGGGIFVPMIDALLLTRAFGVRHYGSLSGAALGIAFGGQLVAPTVGSALFDATGSYSSAFTLYALVSAGAALLFVAAALAVRGARHQGRMAQLGVGARAVESARAPAPAAEGAGEPPTAAG